MQVYIVIKLLPFFVFIPATICFSAFFSVLGRAGSQQLTYQVPKVHRPTAGGPSSPGFDVDTSQEPRKPTNPALTTQTGTPQPSTSRGVNIPSVPPSDRRCPLDYGAAEEGESLLPRQPAAQPCPAPRSEALSSGTWVLFRSAPCALQTFP